MATGNIDQQLAWCESAREILKRSGSSKGKGAQAFDSALEKVKLALATLQRLAPDAAVVTELEERFAAKAEEARQLGLRAKTESDEKLRTPAKQLTTDLETLALAMNNALPQVQQRVKYLGRMTECRKQRAALLTFPYADVSDVNNVLFGAELGDEALDDPALVTKALKTLEGFDKAVKQAEDKQRKGAEDAQLEVQAERRCLERLREVKALLSQAQSGFADKSQITALQTAVDSAQEKVAAKQWTAALTVLTAKTVPDANALKKAEEKQLAGLPQPLLRSIQEQLATYKGLVDDESYVQAKASADEHLREALGLDSEGAERTVQATLISVQSKVTAAQRYKTEADGFASNVAIVLERGKARLPADVQLVLGEELERLKSELAQRRLVPARELGEALEKRANLAQLQANQQWSAWGRIEGNFALALETLRGHAKAAGGTPEARRASALLVLQASDSNKQALLAARDWTGLVALHNQMQAGIQAFDAAVQQYREFAQARTDANTKWGQEVKAMQTTIDRTRRALIENGAIDLNAVLAPLGERLAQLERRWKDRLDNATNEASLGLKGMLDELGLLVKDVAAAGQPETLEQTAKDQANVKARQAFEEDASQLTAVLNALAHLDPAAGDQFAEQSQSLRDEALQTNTAEAWALAQKKFAKVLTDARQRVNEREVERPRDNSQMAQRCRLLTERLKAEQRKLKSTGDKTFLPLFTQLTDELADLTLLSGTPNLEVAKASTKQLDDIERQLRSMEALSAKGSTFGPVRKELELLDKAFDEATTELKDNVPRTLASMQKVLNQLKSDVLTMSPQDALDEIGAVKVSLNLAKGEANKVKTRRKGFLDLVPVVTTKVDLLTQDRTVPNLAEAFRKRLTEIKAQAKDPTKLDFARQRLDELNREIEEAVIDPAKGLDKQTKLLADAEAARLLALQCKAMQADLKTNGKERARKAVADADGDPALVEEIKRMLSTVDDIMKSKAPDHAEAMRLLRLVEQRIEEVVRDPYGPGIGSRKALPLDAQLFAESARKLQAGLRAFPDKVAESVPEVPVAVRKKVSDMVEALALRLNPEAFAQAALQLSDAKQAVRLRREAREAALAKVRDLATLVNEHPQFSALWKNPIDVELKVLASEVDQRLRRLEANIRRAVK